MEIGIHCYLNRERSVQITCSTDEHLGPILTLEHAIRIYATAAQLQQLRDTLATYLAQTDNTTTARPQAETGSAGEPNNKENI